MKNIIHIYGASNSGTTTLGRKISEELGYKFMDTDDYFWLPTNPPYTIKRSKEERIALMKKDISEADNVVISGSLVDWGDELIPLFTLAIRLVTDSKIRIERLKTREKQKFGERIMPDGDMYAQHMEFLEWARKYDTGGANMRSKAGHDEWQKLLLCKQIVLNGADALEENFSKVKMEIDSVIGRSVTVYNKMEEIRLLSPSADYAEDIMRFKQEIILANDDDAFAGCGSLGSCRTIEEWLDILKTMENIETCPEGFVTSNTYLAVRSSDNRIIGIIDLRHHIAHPVLGLWGGHIGYSIRPSERGKGYAKEMLRLNLAKCRERGMDKVMITCSPQNIASAKTIIANGGVYEKDVDVDGEIVRRFWIEL